MASSLKLEIYGSKILRKKSTPIPSINPEVITLGKEMIKTMYDSKGIGLAAPQVGHNIRMFAIDTHHPEFAKHYSSEGEFNLCNRMPLVIVNPEILEFSSEKSTTSEGCLSVPKINADVTRPNKILLKGKILEGESFTYWCDGLLSRCAQHEIDHLNGIIFTDISEKESLKAVAQELKQLKNKTLEKNKK